MLVSVHNKGPLRTTWRFNFNLGESDKSCQNLIQLNIVWFDPTQLNVRKMLAFLANQYKYPIPTILSILDLCFYSRKKLFDGSVPSKKKLDDGTVPSNYLTVLYRKITGTS
jgi:hypothetical protein